MPLHIAIDARRIQDFGIGTYIRSLVHALSIIDHVNHYTLISAEGDVRTIAGLPANTSVTLNDGTDETTFSSNGAFNFPTQLPTGAGYNVTVTAQPTGHTCTVSQGAGSVCLPPRPPASTGLPRLLPGDAIIRVAVTVTP